MVSVGTQPCTVYEVSNTICAFPVAQVLVYTLCAAVWQWGQQPVDWRQSTDHHRVYTNLNGTFIAYDTVILRPRGV